MKASKPGLWKGNLSFIPCSITLCNALCGLSAIIYMMGRESAASPVPVVAIWLVMAAMFFDLFDGYAARRLHAESLHGMQLDSLSDMLSFGVAPAILIYQAGQAWWADSTPGHWIAWAAAGFYAACTLWRLANYNADALSDSTDKDGFTGLPSPAAALSICSAMLLINRIDPSARTTAFVAVAFAFIMGFLMVSGFEFMHLKKIAATGSVALRVTLLVLVAAACVRFGALAFFTLVHLYVFSGPLAEIIIKGSDRAADPLH